MLLPLAYLLFGIGVYCRTVQDSDHGVPIVRNAEKSFVELDIDSEELVDLHDDQPRDVDESASLSYGGTGTGGACTCIPLYRYFRYTSNPNLGSFIFTQVIFILH